MEALDVAHIVINQAINSGRPITLSHLQKILYILDQNFKRINGYPLIVEGFKKLESGEFAQMEVGREYAHFNSRPIIYPEEKNKINLPSDIQNLLEKIIRIPAWELPSYEEIEKNKGVIEPKKENEIATRSVDDTFGM